MSEDEVARLREAFAARLPEGEGRWLHVFDEAAAALFGVPEGDWRDGYKDGKLPGPGVPGGATSDALVAALRDFVVLLPADRWDLLRDETRATVNAALAPQLVPEDET